MIRTAIATVLAGAALTTGLTLAQAGPAGAATAPSSTSSSTACQQVWDALPAQLQADIVAALSLPPREQHRAVLTIRYSALHGVYGDQVKTWAERVEHRRAQIWKSFPAQLKADVRAARSLPFHEQRRAMVAIRTAALAGTYGDQVQHLAELRQTFLQGCPDQLSSYLDQAGDPLAA